MEKRKGMYQGFVQDLIREAKVQGVDSECVKREAEVRASMVAGLIESSPEDESCFAKVGGGLCRTGNGCCLCMCGG